jgi:hypothetical protein
VGLIQGSSTYNQPHASTNTRYIPEVALSSEIDRLLHSFLSVNTNQAYTVGIQAFNHFRQVKGLSHTWPSPNEHINAFIAQLSIHRYKQSTAKAYISAISFHCKLHWTADPTKHFVVQKLLQGMKMSSSASDARLPTTLDILKLMLSNLHMVCSSSSVQSRHISIPIRIVKLTPNT